MMKRARLSAALVATALSIAAPGTPGGGIPVFDVSNLAENIAQVSAMTTQINHMLTQINNQVRMLQTLGGSNYGNVIASLSAQNSDLLQVLAAAQTISYNLSSVQAQVNQLFPKGTQWQSFDMSQLGARRAQWYAALREANESAFMAQSSLNRIAGRNATIQSLLAQSQAADGVVRQQQLTNQLTAALADSMQDMSSAMLASQRALVLHQEQERAEREAGLELARRTHESMSVKDPSPSVPAELPSLAPIK